MLTQCIKYRALVILIANNDYFRKSCSWFINHVHELLLWAFQTMPSTHVRCRQASSSSRVAFFHRRNFIFIFKFLNFHFLTLNPSWIVGLSGCRINMIDIDPGARILRVVEFEYHNPATLGWVVELQGLSNQLYWNKIGSQ